jgi:tight adherence protein C
MTPLQIITVAGLLIGFGMVCAVRAVRPATPALRAALDQLSAEPAVVSTLVPVPSTRDRWGWLPPSVANLLDDHLGVPDADLKIIGWTRAQLAARKVALSLAGFLAPSVVGVLALEVGVGIPVIVPVGLSIALAVILWFLPSQEAKEDARNARLQFRTNLESYLTLVAGERRARGSVEQALEEASEISDSMPFVRLRRVLQRAALSGRKPWRDLHDLGDELNVPELRSLADIASVAADGGAVYNSLLATARSLRHAELADQRTEANLASERMSRPLGLLVTALTLFVMFPFLLRMFGVSS